MTDLDTAAFLAQFKEKYLAKVQQVHEKYEKFKELPPAEAAKADKAQRDYSFLYSFTASVEATLEQNMVLKSRLKELSK
jgi:hypothetical protein